MATATLSHRYLIFSPIVGTLTVASGLVFLTHNLVVTGTLTMAGTSELLVI